MIYEIMKNLKSDYDIMQSSMSMVNNKFVKIRPFIKWVGGKRNIINHLIKELPKNIKNYYEPFAGGAALFYELHDKVNYSFLSDLNIDLIVAYQVIKNNTEKLIALLKQHKELHCQEYFYKVRSMQNIEEPVENTARFIYLLKTCFNGLYRVNKDGNFNTPIGSYKNPNIVDECNLKLVSKALKNADIKYQDFRKITPQKGDFIYFDPPYHQLNNNSFVGYLSGGFMEKDQIKLRDFAIELDREDIKFMISNSDTEFIHSIYKNFKIKNVAAPRFINCKSDKRHSILETLITNY
jgi:DNA adenine methylase